MQSTTNIAMPIIIGIISFAIGFSLHFKDFKRVVTHPTPVLAGLVSQILMLPLLAIALIYFWDIKPIYKMGFVLIAICPGGTMSNFLAYVLKGRVALSVSLTALNSFIILFSIPFFLELSASLFGNLYGEVNIGFSQTFGNIFFTVILPTLAGLASNEILPSRASEKIKSYLRYIVISMLVLMVTLVLFTGDGVSPAKLLDSLWLVFPLLLLNITSMAMGFYLSGIKVLRISHESRFTIAIEVGLQNSVLAIYIATNLLQNQEMAIMPALYGAFSLFTSWGLAWLFKKHGGD